MTATIAARLGFEYGWTLGEDNWNDGTDYDFRASDVLHGLLILDATLHTPPGSPADGDTYIVHATATGAWTGKEGKIAAYQAGVWYFYPVATGLRARFDASGNFYWYDGSAWTIETPSVSTLNAGKILGNSTGSPTAPEEVGIGQGLTFTGTNLAVGGSGTLTLTGFASVLVNDPVNAQEAVSKAYVDAFIQGLSPKPSAQWATTTTLAANTYANGTLGTGATLTGNSNGALAVDSGAPAVADLVLVKDEAAPAHNGLYVVTAAGDGSHVYVLTRHVSMDRASEFSGSFLAVESGGTINANTLWFSSTPGVVVVGTTSITFTQLNAPGSYSAGTGISLGGTIFSLAAAAADTIKANITGGSAAPTDVTLTALLDALLSSNQGVVIARGASTWGVIAPGVSGQALISQGTSVLPAFAALPGVIWNAGSVTTLGITGPYLNSGTLSNQKRSTITATTTGTIDPTAGDACLVNMPTTTASTLTINVGQPGQHLRLDIKMGATAQVVNFDTTVVFGADLTSYTATVTANKTDRLGFVTDDGTHWAFCGALHGF